MKKQLTRLRWYIHSFSHWQAECTTRDADTGEVLCVEHVCQCGMRKKVTP